MVVREPVAAFALAASLLLASVICPCLATATDISSRASHDCGSDTAPDRETPRDDCESTCARDTGVEANRLALLPAASDCIVAALPETSTIRSAADYGARRTPTIKPPGPGQSISILYSVLIV